MTPKMAAPEMTPKAAVPELTLDVVAPGIALDVASTVKAPFRKCRFGRGEGGDLSITGRPSPSLPHLATSLSFCFVFIVLERSVGE